VPATAPGRALAVKGALLSLGRTVKPTTVLRCSSELSALARRLVELSEAARRLCRALRWIRATGLRLGEVTALRCEDLVPPGGEGGAHRAEPWLLEVRDSARVTKRLPIAAGLGGGSSDAAAALRLADRALSLGMDETALAEVSRVIGADGPMCLHARSAWAEGRGEVLTFEPNLPPLPALLVNPGVPSPTGAVYRAYDAAPRALEARPTPPADWSAAGVIDWLARQRNDLEAPAIALQPVIGAAMQAVAALPEARLTRMSGSGATVFSLFATREAAEAAARQLASEQPEWWITPTTLAAP